MHWNVSLKKKERKKKYFKAFNIFYRHIPQIANNF